MKTPDIEIARIEARIEEVRQRERRQSSFIEFAKQVRPDVIIGRHHNLMAEKFEAIARGEIKRLMIFMPPGHTKSLFGSILLPAWFIGKFPDKRILHISHTAELVQGFSREVRDIVQIEDYREIFPGVELRADSKAVGRWNTTAGGIYTAAGVGGAIAGKRGEIGIIDDPISEQDAYSDTAQARFQQWYPGGFRTRLMPGAPIVWIQTRWQYNDPAGWKLKEAEQSKSKEQWEVIELPAILDERAAEALGQGAKAGEALFPELWPLSELEATRGELPESQWESLYLQKPQPEEGGILKRKWWRIWGKEDWTKDRALPRVEHVFVSWDTAYSEKDLKSNSYSAATVWGVFWNDKTDRHNLLLMAAWAGQVDYPELREKARELERTHKADAQLIEKKASGQSLIQDLRRAKGVAIREYMPDRDKVSRAYAVQTMLASGQIWAPERKWAKEVIDHLALFPYGSSPSSDYTDTATQAWLYLANRWWVTHPDDDDDPMDDVVADINDWRNQSPEQRHRGYG